MDGAATTAVDNLHDGYCDERKVYPQAKCTIGRLGGWRGCGRRAGVWLRHETIANSNSGQVCCSSAKWLDLQ